MPNLYATLDDIRNVAPDALLTATTSYDDLFLQISGTISRFIDRECNRVFYPQIATRYFAGSGEKVLYVGDLLSITSVAYSYDGGQNYTAMTDYIAMKGDDFNALGSYDSLWIDENSTSINKWPKGQKSVRVVGTWGFAENRDDAWVGTADTVLDDPLLIDGTSLSVADVDGADIWGIAPRISVGSILQIESELAEVTATDTSSANTATIIRARNGSTAAEHSSTTTIQKWKVHDLANRACIIQAIRQFKRGQVAFGDAEAIFDTGKIMHIKTLDPEAVELLKRVRAAELVW